MRRSWFLAIGLAAAMAAGAASGATAPAYTSYTGQGFTLSYPSEWRSIDLSDGALSLVPPGSNPGGLDQVLVAAHLITDADDIEAEVRKWTQTGPLVSRRTLHPAPAEIDANGCVDIEEFAVRQETDGLTMLSTSYVCSIHGRMYAVHVVAKQSDKNQPAYQKGALEMLRSLRTTS